MNSQPQAESLLAAERQRSHRILEEQTEKREVALYNVTQWGEEAVESERTNTVEAKVETNIFGLELEEEMKNSMQGEQSASSAAIR